MHAVFWFVTVLASIAAGFVMIGTGLGAKSAPQEAAGYAMACAFAIVPYVFSRAAQLGSQKSSDHNTKLIVEAIDRLARKMSEIETRVDQIQRQTIPPVKETPKQDT